MTIALLIEPLDLLFCRDGRPIVAGEGSASGSSMPGPQVLAGALRTALLRHRNQLPGDGSKPQQEHIDAVVKQISIRGPLLADLKLQKPLLPMPADLVGDKPKHGIPGSVTARLRPQSDIPGWVPPDDTPNALALWPAIERVKDTKASNEKHRPGEIATQAGFLTWEGFQAWAKGTVPRNTDVRQSGTLWLTETRTQVGLKADTATAEDGVLFSTRYLRLARGIGFYVEVDGPENLPAYFSFLIGGDRRQARAIRIPPVTWPASGTVALAITPVILPSENPRCPTAWKSHCRGCAILGADPISGWDLAANEGKGAPKATRWTIHPGSVWHLDTPLPDTPSIGNECDAGYGWIARGIAPSST